jgi:hypothetical protein
MNPPERLEEFKQWLSENHIDFRTDTYDGKEYVKWEAENTDKVSEFDHLAETLAAAHGNAINGVNRH